MFYNGKKEVKALKEQLERERNERERVVKEVEEREKEVRRLLASVD